MGNTATAATNGQATNDSTVTQGENATTSAPGGGNEAGTTATGTGAGAAGTPEPNQTGGTNEVEVNEHGFPDGTAIADMSPEHQAAYWKHKARKHEQRANAAHNGSNDALTPDQVKQMIDEAVSTTKRNGALALARAQLDNALASAGHTDEQRTAIIDTLDLTKFLSDTDDVVADKVTAFAGTLGGPVSTADTTRHMGNRSSGTPSGVDAGAAMYADRRKK